MNSKLSSLILILMLCCVAAPQTSKRRGVVRKPTVPTPPAQPVVKPPPTPAIQPPKLPAAPVSLAIVNGQSLTTADLEPAVRQELETLDAKLADARRSMLDLQINTTLLQIEAKKRRIDTHRLYETEVSNRIPTFTPAQIKKFVDDNREQFAGMDPSIVNQQVTAYLHDEAESKLADDLVNRLRRSNPVVMGVDINSPTLNPASVVATIAGQPITAAPLIERLKPIIYKLRLEAYEATKERVDRLID